MTTVTDDTRDKQQLLQRIETLEAELRVARQDADILDGVLAAVPAVVFRLDENDKFVETNRLIDGFTYSEVIGSQLFDHLPPTEQAATREIFAEVRRTKVPRHYQIIGPGPSGSTAAYDSYVAVRGENGLVVVAIDVTERFEREAAAGLSKATSDLAVETTGIGLWSYDARSGDVLWNDAMHGITGSAKPLQPSEFINGLVHPDDQATAREAFGKCIAGGHFQTPVLRLRRGSELRATMTSGEVMLNAEGQIERVLGVTLDLTADISLEEKLRQRQGLEAVGQLAAGVAHNFNNILASILPVLDLVSPHVPPRYQEVLEGAKSSARRAAELVRHLMTFAGQRSESARLAVCLGDLASRAVNLCRRMMEHEVRLVLDDRAGDARVLCSPAAIEQSIMNLMLNARDAVLETGRGQGAVRVEVICDEAAADVILRVTDDGVGMSEDVQRRIFEPFYTTKEVHRGTGLGLAIVYATMRDHGGSTTCTSQLGVGSSFELRLPRHTGNVSVRPHA